MDSPSFPEYYASLNPHMCLFMDDNQVWHLCPPNQCDWIYTMRKINDTTWLLTGHKDDIFANGPEECRVLFKYFDNMWVSCNETEE